MLSIIIPAYNEAKHLKRNLERTKAYLRKEGIPYEIIVVNDGSTDQTARIAKETKGITLITYKENKGKGYAVRKGMLAAKGTHTLFMDADLATSLEAIPKALKEARTHDIIIGSRKITGAHLTKKQPWLRNSIGKLFPLILNLIGLSKHKDTQCGFKLFSKEAAKNIFSKSTIDRFAFDVEALYLAKKQGYRIKEMPVRWKDNPNSRVQPVVDGTRMLLDVLSIKATHSTTTAGKAFARPLRWLAEKAQRFLTYILFSGIATLIDFLTLITLTELLRTHYLLSAAIGYLVGMIIHYALNKKHTFANKSKRYAAQLSVHVMVALTGLLLHQALMYAFVEGMGIWYVWAKVFTTAIVLCWNYYGHSTFTFGLFK